MYRGQVSAVDSAGVYVLVPALHPTAPFGPLEHVGATPAVGARVLVVDCGGESEPDLVVLTGGFPATSTDNAVARFNGTAGALQNSGVTIDDAGCVLTMGTGPRFVAAQSTDDHGSAYISGANTKVAQIELRQLGNARWVLRKSADSETGSDAGSDFVLQSRGDGGASSDRIGVNRASGKVTIVAVGATAGLELGSSGPRIMSGSGAPESVVTAPVGSLWLRTDGGAGTTLYVKESGGSGNTGWVGK